MIAQLATVREFSDLELLIHNLEPLAKNSETDALSRLMRTTFESVSNVAENRMSSQEP